ncbi:MAG: hypothetical protein GY861_04075 [bacterium]|nr:hypothetical protein [bacterium]
MFILKPLLFGLMITLFTSGVYPPPSAPLKPDAISTLPDYREVLAGGVQIEDKVKEKGSGFSIYDNEEEESGMDNGN